MSCTNLLIAVGLFIFYAPVSGYADASPACGALKSSVSVRQNVLAAIGLYCFARLSSTSAVATAFAHILGRPLSRYASILFALAVFVPHFVIGATTILHYTLPPTLPGDVAQDSMMHDVSAVHYGILALVTFNGLAMGYVSMATLFQFVIGIAHRVC